MTRWPVLVLVLVVGCKTKAAPPVPSEPAPVVAAAPPEPSVAIERAATATRESSALVLGRVGGVARAFVADEDDSAIVEIDPATKSVVASSRLGTRPRDVLLLANGRLAVTLPDADAVAVLARDAKGALKEIARAKTPPDPIALALDPTDATLYVSTGASHSLVAFETAALDEAGKPAPKTTITLGREPRAVLVSRDGARAFVAHAVEDFVSVVELGAAPAVETRGIGNHAACSGGGMCASARIARNTQALVRAGERGVVALAAQSSPIPGPGGSKSVLCPPPRRPNADGTFAFSAPPKKEGYGFGDGDNGPPVTADMPTFDETTGKKWSIGLPPKLGAGCLLPRAGVAAEGGSLLVACLGSARVERFVPAKQEEWMGTFTFGAKGTPPRDEFSNGIMPNLGATAISVPAGPSAIALDEGGDAFVWSQFARTLARIPAKGTAAETVLAVPRVERRDEAWLRGRELFYANGDSRISTDGRACASCHVDGGDDGLTWKTPNGPRRTRFLRGEVANGPYGWKGEHATLAEHIGVTMKNLGGSGLPEDAIADLGAYVTALPKRRPATSDDATIARGKELFASAECSHCHSEGGSDRKVHDVGTGGAFMTPTLASAGTRRELMHDGRFKDLDALIAGAPSMGRGASLSADERHALALYLATL